MPGLSYILFFGYAALVFFAVAAASTLAMALIGVVARRLAEKIADSGRQTPRWLAFCYAPKPVYQTPRRLAWCLIIPAASTFAWLQRSAAQTAGAETSFKSIVGVAQPVSAQVDHLQSVGTFDTVYWIHFTCSPSDLKTILSSGKYEMNQKLLGKAFDLHLMNPPDWVKLNRSATPWTMYDQFAPGDPDDRPDPQGRTLVVRSDGREAYGWASDEF